MANFKQVNKAIKAQFPNLSLEVVRGDGYVYFTNGVLIDNTGVSKPKAIHVDHVKTSTEQLTEWAIQEIKDWMPKERKPSGSELFMKEMESKTPAERSVIVSTKGENLAEAKASTLGWNEAIKSLTEKDTRLEGFEKKWNGSDFSEFMAEKQRQEDLKGAFDKYIKSLEEAILNKPRNLQNFNPKSITIATKEHRVFPEEKASFVDAVSKGFESLGIPLRYFGFPSNHPNNARCERCGSSTVESCDILNCGFLGAGNGVPETETYVEPKYTKEQHEAIAEIMKHYKDRIDKHGPINTHYEYGGIKRNNGLPVDIVLLNKLCGFDPEVPETVTKIE